VDRYSAKAIKKCTNCHHTLNVFFVLPNIQHSRHDSCGKYVGCKTAVTSNYSVIYNEVGYGDNLRKTGRVFWHCTQSLPYSMLWRS